MNNSHLIPVLALAGAGSVMLVFWGAGKFKQPSTEDESVAVTALEEADAGTESTPGETDYDFSWDDEPEKSPAPATADSDTATAEMAFAETATGETATVETATAETETAEWSNDKGSSFWDTVDGTNESAESTVADSFDAETKGSAEEFASGPFNESGSSDETELEVVGNINESSSTKSDSTPAWDADSEVSSDSKVSAEPEVADDENNWAVKGSEESVDLPLEEMQPIEPIVSETKNSVLNIEDPAGNNGGFDEIASSEPAAVEPIAVEPTELESSALEPTKNGTTSSDVIPELVPMFSLAIKNLSGDTANFCVDGQAITLTPGQSFVAEKSGSDTFEYRESCEQASSVPMKAGRYNVKAFPTTAQPNSQAYRATSATQN